MFGRLTIDGVTVDSVTYPAGAVVAIDGRLLKRLADRGHAEPHPGPASGPEALAKLAAKAAK